MTFGIADTSKNILVCIFDDKDGSKMKKLAKEIEGQAESLDKLSSIMDLKIIRKVGPLNISARANRWGSVRCPLQSFIIIVEFDGGL